MNSLKDYPPQLVAAQLQLLVNDGALASPITYKNHLITRGGPTPIFGDTGTDTVVYNSDGWERNPTSPIGARRSRGVDALIAELNQKGYNDVAARIPRFHLVRPEQAPETVYSFAVADPTRYDRPSEAYQTESGLTDEQLDQIACNLQANDNIQFAMAMGIGGNSLKTAYRGQTNHPGFPPFVYNGQRADFSPPPPPGWLPPPQLERAFPAPGIAARLYLRTPTRDQEGNAIPGRDKIEAASDNLPNHYAYDLWWEVRNDGAITRSWRSWAISIGCNLS